MKIENVAVISLEDYAEYQELKRKSVKHRIDGCLMHRCDDFNYDQVFDNSKYSSYELISKDYGGKDVFKAISECGDDVILFGEWVD